MVYDWAESVNAQYCVVLLQLNMYIPLFGPNIVVRGL